jgi:uncharacterized protein
VEIEYVTGVERVLEEIEAFLLEEEARHNLALGILSTAVAHPGVYAEVRGWVVREGDRVVGAGLQTPPHNLVLAAPTAAGALDALADAVDEDLPGVVGATPEVDAFARAWAERRHGSIVTRVEQRIYAMRRARPPRPTDGTMRLADPSDRALLLEWILAFSEEALRGGPSTDAEQLRRTLDGRLSAPDAGFGLWEVAGSTVSLAGFGGATPNGIRINPVYTPPEHRGRGYGTAVTAAVSQFNLDRGRRFCFLYTDLANPTSNAIYQRIGYEPVCDSRELAFSAPQRVSD